MQELIAYIEAEQPRVNEVLDRETGKLNHTVRPLVEHVLRAGGKRLRPILTILTARAMGYRKDNIYPMSCSLEFLHSATLLHDDILDDAEFRRGLPAAHTVYGQTETILAGDVLLALGNRLMADYGDARLTACISDAIMATATGEVLEIAHTRDAALSEERYLEIITGKTAYLIQAACRCGAILAGAEPELERAASDFGMALGVAFQLVDDALDYSSSAEVAGKPVGADLAEGKLTLPMLLYLKDQDVETQQDFAELFQQENSDPDLQDKLGRVAAKVRSLGYDKKTRDRAAQYLDTARKSLEMLPDCEERTLLGQALDYVLNRQK